jgi:23S rRNA (uracil1939-C5)-methyltransferase
VVSPVLPSCPHRPPCPGCPRYGQAAPPPAALEALRALAARTGAPEPRIVSGPLSGFRHRARLAIRGRLGSPKIGIFEEGSHRVVHIPNCVVHHPLINDVARAVRSALVQERISPYSDQAHAGTARYLQVVVERASQSAQVVLVTNSEDATVFGGLLGVLQRELGERLHSLWLNPQLERSNTILGPTFSLLAGPASVRETLGGAAVFFPPGAFGQNHLGLFERLVEHVHSVVPEGSRVLELYAGVGAIGLGLTARAASIGFNELGAHSLAGLELGIAALAPELASRTHVLAGRAADHAERAGDADLVIADPPRKGLDREVLDALVRHRPRRFVYVSCGLSAFLAQAEELVQRGFALTGITAFGLFPFTEHVEVVGVFET